MTVSPARAVTAPAPATRSVREPRRYLVFGVVAVALFMASVDQTIVATALSTLQRDLGAAVNWSSWTITVYALGQIMVMPLAGRISDQFGRRRVFVTAIALFTVASLCCGLANDIYVLVALRAVQAIGGGAIMPSATGIVSDQFGPDRDRAIGLFTSIFPIGGIVGPILGGVFVTYWSWRWIFLVNVPIGIVVLVLAAVFIPRTEKRTHGRVDLPGVASARRRRARRHVRGQLPRRGQCSRCCRRSSCWHCWSASLALVAFVHHAGHAADPFIPLRLLRGSGFAVMNFINFVFGVAVLGFATLVPLYAQDRYGVAILAAGTLLTARAVGMIAVAGVSTFALAPHGLSPADARRLRALRLRPAR